MGASIHLLGATRMDPLVTQAGARVGVVQAVLLGATLPEPGLAVLEVVGQ